MTIPTLLQNTNQAELKTAWKRAYGNASQAYITALSQDEDIFKGTSCSYTASIPRWNAFTNSFNIIKNCNTNPGNCWSQSLPSNIPGHGGTIHLSDAQGQSIITADGMLWITDNDGCSVISVDVNGYKPPNTPNKDIFAFGLINRMYPYDIISPEPADSSSKYLYE